MGTKTQQSTTNQYQPQGMAAYQSMIPALSQAATGYMNNPFGNPFFQTQQQLGTRQAGQLGGSAMSNIARNFTTSGLGGGVLSPAALEMMQNQGRANTGLQAQMGFLNPVQNALQMQQGAMGLAAGFSPLQTGQNQVQSTSGLGTWLPQLVGAGLGFMNPASSLMHGLGGVMGGGGGGGMGAFGEPQVGYGGTGLPGQGFGTPFFSGGGGGPMKPQGPQMSNAGYGFGQ